VTAIIEGKTRRAFADRRRADGAEFAVALRRKGRFGKFGVKLIGANIESMKSRRRPRAFQSGDGRNRHSVPRKAVSRTLGRSRKNRRRRPVIRRSFVRVLRSAERAAARLLTRKNLRKSSGRAGRVADFASFDRRIDSRLEGIRTRSDARFER
jgi:hypothetical protein